MNIPQVTTTEILKERVREYVYEGFTIEEELPGSVRLSEPYKPVRYVLMICVMVYCLPVFFLIVFFGWSFFSPRHSPVIISINELGQIKEEGMTLEKFEALKRKKLNSLIQWDLIPFILIIVWIRIMYSLITSGMLK